MVAESSVPENLNNSQYEDIDEEAECSVFSKYSDMNRVVSSILRTKQNDDEEHGQSRKRRQRLTFEQMDVLEHEFLKNTDWSEPGLIKKLSQRLGLPKSKIYKWNWDMRRKTNAKSAEGSFEGESSE